MEKRLQTFEVPYRWLVQITEGSHVTHASSQPTQAGKVMWPSETRITHHLDEKQRSDKTCAESKNFKSVNFPAIFGQITSVRFPIYYSFFQASICKILSSFFGELSFWLGIILSN